MPCVALAVVPSPAHRDPTHLEHPRRLEGLAEAASSAFGDSLIPVAGSPASEDAVLAVHDPAHLEFLRRACRQAPAIIDYAPTYVSPASFECALEAAGATLAVLKAVLGGEARRDFASSLRQRGVTHLLYSPGDIRFFEDFMPGDTAQRAASFLIDEVLPACGHLIYTDANASLYEIDC